ncbi:MAG: hypothetical protein AB1696_28970 [Planctomycetota bacterium]
MIELKEKYLVDEKGRTAAVVLDVRAYRRLLQHLEDMEDALELDKARRAAKSFRPYHKVRSELKKAGRL